jgi:hypothetical protein
MVRAWGLRTVTVFRIPEAASAQIPPNSRVGVRPWRRQSSRDIGFS